MPLSDDEREQLRLLEQQLRIEAPELYEFLAPPTHSRRNRLLAGWLLAFLGAVAILLGLYASLVPVASIGLVGIAVGLFVAHGEQTGPADITPAR
jgi:hypothetical protein